jgi:hypothetical protein
MIIHYNKNSKSFIMDHIFENYRKKVERRI